MSCCQTKSLSTHGSVRCVGCCGIKLSILQSNFTFHLPATRAKKEGAFTPPPPWYVPVPSYTFVDQLEKNRPIRKFYSILLRVWLVCLLVSWSTVLNYCVRTRNWSFTLDSVLNGGDSSRGQRVSNPFIQLKFYSLQDSVLNGGDSSRGQRASNPFIQHSAKSSIVELKGK
jgi:hypothetical protein